MIRQMTIAAAASSALLLGACTDPATLGTDRATSNTTNGAILGGVLGAGVTAVTGGSAKNIALATAAGAVAGGLIGNQMDKQAAELRNQLSNDGITVTSTGDSMIVSLPQDITFDTDSYAISAALRPEINKVAQNLVKYPDSTVQVIGHTDNVGDATYNLGLSQRRANAVADLLQADGVSFSRLQTIGRGEEQPVASNLTPEGRAQNRRVEIVVVPKAS